MTITLDQKTNGSFSRECQWTTDGVGKDFTGWTPSCKITKSGVLVHEFTFNTDLTWVDQSLGKVLLKVIDISSWPIGLLYCDLKFTKDLGSFKRVTKTFRIETEGGIT